MAPGLSGFGGPIVAVVIHHHHVVGGELRAGTGPCPRASVGGRGHVDREQARLLQGLLQIWRRCFPVVVVLAVDDECFEMRPAVAAVAITDQVASAVRNRLKDMRETPAGGTSGVRKNDCPQSTMRQVARKSIEGDCPDFPGEDGVVLKKEPCRRKGTGRRLSRTYFCSRAESIPFRPLLRLGRAAPTRQTVRTSVSPCRGRQPPKPDHSVDRAAQGRVNSPFAARRVV